MIQATDMLGRDLNDGDEIVFEQGKTLTVAVIDKVRYLVRNDRGRNIEVPQAAAESWGLRVVPHISSSGIKVTDKVRAREFPDSWRPGERWVYKDEIAKDPDRFEVRKVPVMRPHAVVKLS